MFCGTAGLHIIYTVIQHAFIQAIAGSALVVDSCASLSVTIIGSMVCVFFFAL